MPDFLNLFENLLDFASLNEFQLYMSRDFNIDMCVLPRHELDFISFLDSNRFYNTIETPTRITGISSNTLDLFITNVDNEHVTPGVLILSISHYFFHFYIDKSISPTRHTE